MTQLKISNHLFDYFGVLFDTHESLLKYKTSIAMPVVERSFPLYCHTRVLHHMLARFLKHTSLGCITYNQSYVSTGHVRCSTSLGSANNKVITLQYCRI